MKRILSSILASSMLLSTLTVGFARENTQTSLPEEETLQAIHTETLSTTNFPSASQLPDYAVKAFSSVLDTLPHTKENNTLSVCYLDYLGNGDPLMYALYNSAGGGVGLEIWGATEDGTAVKGEFPFSLGQGVVGTTIYQGEPYLLYLSLASMPDEPSKATMYGYSNGVFAAKGEQVSWYGGLSEAPFSQEYVLYELSNSSGLADLTSDFVNHSQLATTASTELQSLLSNSIAPASVPERSISAELDAIKAKLPYTGDISKMNLSPEQAIAMAEEIESFYTRAVANLGVPFQANYYDVALFDVGDGTPALLQYKSAELSPYGGCAFQELYWNSNTGNLEEFGGTGMWIGVNVNPSDTEIWFGDALQGEMAIFHASQHQIKAGVMERIGYEMLYFSYKERVSESQLESEIQKALDEYNLGSFSMNWDHVHGDYTWEVLVINGQTVPESTGARNAGRMWSVQEFDLGIFWGMRGDNWGDGLSTASLLRQYAELAQVRFSFSDFFGNNEVTDLFSSLQLPGTMLECYQVTNHFYYLIMEENGVEKGYLICAIKENGEIVYKIIHESTQILAEDALVAEGNHYNLDSNILLQFDAIKDFESKEDYLTYFTNALRNITGVQLNDQGKSELALSMQDSIVNFATFVKSLRGETGEISHEEVAPLVEKSNSLYQEFQELLRAEQAELNKDLEQTVRVVLQGLDEKNWTIFLNQDLIGELQGNHLQVFLSSGQQGVEISADDLESLLHEHEGLFINVQETGTDQYAIHFADGEGNDIEKLENPVKIFLPTDNEFATVILDYAQGSENWGGQFNSATNTIQFSTIHPGTYLIVDNSVEIFDVPEEYLSMIQFMVSKGFFTVDENGYFYPEGTMSRNDFTKTIVSMFFALDHDLSSSFHDVFPDSPYYSYIASGEARDIVAGYDDGYFYGDIILTEEMAFASIAQTLVDKKGYIFPDDLSFYLNSLSGGTSGNDWSKPGIALSVRDGIILPSETINATGDISRQNAAVYLYRLFMLLEEKQQINFELVEEISLSEEIAEPKEEIEQEQSFPYGASAIAGLAIVGIALGLKRKKPEEKS